MSDKLSVQAVQFLQSCGIQTHDNQRAIIKKMNEIHADLQADNARLRKALKECAIRAEMGPDAEEACGEIMLVVDKALNPERYPENDQ